MPDTTIQVENLSKRYRIGLMSNIRRTRSEMISDLVTAPLRRFSRLRKLSHFTDNDGEAQDIVWALRDVSFDVRAGEVVGIIGGNGAGKTTLLKILSRITEPTGGHAQINGRVGSLLEVGTGFHRELTGRENVYLTGAVLGMTRKDIARKFDEIVAFAEVEAFLNTPSKRYSTGMIVRLAFAVAAHLEPEILLVDEVLAVGDVAFQNKCLGKMDEVAKEGRTVLFVSHNMGTITRLCPRALWIDNGTISQDGPSRDVVAAYLSVGGDQGPTWFHPPSHCNDPQVRLISARVLSAGNQVASVVSFSDCLKLEVAYEVVEPVSGTSIFGRLIDSHGNVVWTSSDVDTNGWNGRVREPGRYLSLCNVPGQLLRPGRYYLTIGSRTKTPKLWMGQNREAYAENDHENVLSFDISEVGYDWDLGRTGIITPSLHWDVKRIGEMDRIT